MTLILNGTDGLSDVDGTAATPAIRGTDANTGIFFPAADTIAFSEGGVEQMRLNAAGDLQMNSGYGSVGTAYGCRAWVNFEGDSTPAIRASGNVSSITYNAVGDFDVNFTTAMPDANYSVSGIAMRDSANIAVLCIFGNATYTTAFVSTTKVRVNVRENTNQSVSATAVCVSIFR
jgi:hypothetical protein